MFNVFFNSKSSLVFDSKKSNKEKIKNSSLLQINLSPSLERSSKKTNLSIFQNFDTSYTNHLKVTDHIYSDGNNLMIGQTHDDQDFNETNKTCNDDFSEEINNLSSDDGSENSLFETSLTESSISEEEEDDSNIFTPNDIINESELYPNSPINLNQFLIAFYAVKAKHKFLKENLCEKCEIEKSVLIRFGLAPQIKEIVEKDDNFCQIIEANAKARAKSDQTIQNALDGKIYQDMIKTVSYDKLVISLNLNTDGCPLVKSKNYTLWPLLGTILELDQSCREKFENMIILGI
ncbi:unnamed protein product [Brachionus calyciflorus]|uniref:Uncharacterized protein n=1 Tax=Brachionus calyciflorus TaxID=104777 RepID=A0A814L241_9BILA|nr:unnamed protein product [Brachionus calyciflorus]